MKRKTRKKKSPVDANRDHFSNARTFVQHDNVDHSWIINHSWMTFTYAQYAFTLKTPTRVHSARNEALCNECTPTVAAVKSYTSFASNLREIEKHATFARRFDNGPVLVKEQAISRGRYSIDKLHTHLSIRDTISLRFLRGSLLQARREMCKRLRKRRRSVASSD